MGYIHYQKLSRMTLLHAPRHTASSCSALLSPAARAAGLLHGAAPTRRRPRRHRRPPQPLAAPAGYLSALWAWRAGVLNEGRTVPRVRLAADRGRIHRRLAGYPPQGQPECLFRLRPRFLLRSRVAPHGNLVSALRLFGKITRYRYGPLGSRFGSAIVGGPWRSALRAPAARPAPLKEGPHIKRSPQLSCPVFSESGSELPLALGHSPCLL